jgi:pimeloyl-ACP methyl ester carboxylesterase
VRTELVSIATDTAPLDGAFYTPPDGPGRAAALFLHGHALNFYSGPSRFLPPFLAALGISCLCFNRRGHDILCVRDSREAQGGALSITRQALADTGYAANWLASRGFVAPILIGHSYGGTLAVAHAAGNPETPALVLLSAHAGGDKVRKTGVFAGSRGEDTLREAQAMVSAGHGSRLLQMPDFWFVASAHSIVDRMANTPDILALAPGIRCPSLYIRGADESAEFYPVEEFRRLASAECRIELVPGLEHFYTDGERLVAPLVTQWLQDLTAAGCLPL